MTKIEDAKKDVADLHWLAYLLTGQRDLSIEIAVDAIRPQTGEEQFFPEWMRAWSRRIVIAKALAATRAELADSARRTGLAGVDRSAPAPRNWSLRPDMTKARLEEALLEIDIFPRAAVVLSIFEGIGIADAAIILDADATLVRKAQAIGLRELVRNLAPKEKDAVPARPPALRLALATH
jgi:DNA-directed RNA polymerase specialized sigma24 family protein